MAKAVGITQQNSPNTAEFVVVQSDPAEARHNDESIRAVGECQGACFA